MTTLNKIGDELFISLTRPPGAERQINEVETRSGQDQVVVWNTGTKVQPFTAEAVRDVANLSAVYAKQRDYEALPAAGQLEYVWAGLDTGLEVVVLSYELVSAQVVLTPIGGVQAGAWLMRSTFTLLPRQPIPEP